MRTQCRTWRRMPRMDRRMPDMGVLPDMDAVNACTHVTSAENMPGMDSLGKRTYTSV